MLRRGTSYGDLAGFMPGDYYENSDKLSFWSLQTLKDRFEGTVGEYKGFTSTSSLYDRGFDGDVEMIFYVPKGTHASSVMSISRYGASEGETILPPGTKIKIHSIDRAHKEHGSNIRVFAEIIS